MKATVDTIYPSIGANTLVVTDPTSPNDLGRRGSAYTPDLTVGKEWPRSRITAAMEADGAPLWDKNYQLRLVVNRKALSQVD